MYTRILLSFQEALGKGLWLGPPLAAWIRTGLDLHLPGFAKRRGRERKDFTRRLWSRRRRQWHPTPVLLPGKSHGWRSLVGCRPWGR